MDYIYHYGVKGMKWGVRRTPEQLGHPYSKRSAKDRVLSPKQNLWRVTSDPKEETKTDLIKRENIERGTKVVDSLKEQGYDGMVDMTDRYSWDTMDPTIIFDRKKLKTKKVTDVRDLY